MSSNDIARDAIGIYGAVQHQWELARLLDVLDAAKPKLILEIGCWSGGTLWAWAQTGAELVAVTHPRDAHILRPHGAEVVLANSVSCHDRLAETLRGRVPGFVFIDGDHSYGMASSDWELAEEMAPGAIVGFHDIDCPGEPGPWRVFSAAAKSYPSMTIIQPGEQKGIGLIFT